MGTCIHVTSRFSLVIVTRAVLMTDGNRKLNNYKGIFTTVTFILRSLQLNQRNVNPRTYMQTHTPIVKSFYR